MRAPPPDRPAPPEAGLRELMAHAAALASAASADPTLASPSDPSTARPPRSSHSRAATPRRHSLNRIAQLHVPAADSISKNASLPPVADGSRLAAIDEVASQVETKWTHPHNSQQYESKTLHQVRAILYMNKSLVTQSFVSAVSGVSQGSLSHYVRGIFRGNQDNVEDRLAIFVRDFADGKLDHILEDARAAARPATIPITTDPSTPSTPAMRAAALRRFRSIPSSAAPSAIPSASHISNPPIPPPPPPQLRPAPWAPPSPPPAPPSADASVTAPSPAVAPSSAAAPIGARPPRMGAVPVSEPIPTTGQSSMQPDTSTNGIISPPLISPDKPPMQLTDRARRAQRRRHIDSRSRSGTAKPRPSFPPVPGHDGGESHPLTPVQAVERAFHALVAPIWSDEHPHIEPLLLPIELFVKEEDQILHMYTQWDVNERHISPEAVADRIRRARRLPVAFVQPAAKQIRRALFHAGIVCPAPPQATEDRRLLRIAVELQDGNDIHLLRDECEWDISTVALNSPEVFAQHLCADARVSQRHTIAVARALRDRIVIAQALAYGDDETRAEARAKLDEDDALLHPLPPVSNALTKAAAEDRRAREREQNEKIVAEAILEPLIEKIPAEAERRRNERVRRKERERVMKELQEARRREEAERKRKRELEAEADIEVEEEALKIYQERNLDFRPYLALVVSRDERPCLWLPPAFDRRRRKQLTFPMAPQSRKAGSGRVSTNARSSKRRRHSRRDDGATLERRTSASGREDSDDLKRQREEIKVAPAGTGPAQSTKTETQKVLTLRLRLKPPPGWSSGTSRSGENKKRRR